MRPFAPTLRDTAASREDAARRFRHHAQTAPASLEQLHAAHAAIHTVAERVSGTAVDAHKRAVAYYAIYEDSAGNFMFPLIASHGSMWGVTHTQRIERQLCRLLPLSRHGRLQRWIDALDDVRDINRRVFVEIYTTFYFTRYYGQHPQADQVVRPEILALYNEVHAAVETGRPLSIANRQRVYYDVFVHEQHDIVDPGIQQAAAACGNPWLVRILKHVRPRFRYFPRRERLSFTDFTSVDQRNREGLRALAFAEEVGAARVLEALSEY